jgi:Helix-turn-helix domain
MPKTFDGLTRSQVQGVDRLLLVEEVADIYRRSPATIKTYCQKGIFSPAPFRKYPYRWRKSDIDRDLASREPLPHANHGYATTKKRPAQAKLGSKVARVRRAAGGGR